MIKGQHELSCLLGPSKKVNFEPQYYNHHKAQTITVKQPARRQPSEPRSPQFSAFGKRALCLPKLLMAIHNTTASKLLTMDRCPHSSWTSKVPLSILSPFQHKAQTRRIWPLCWDGGGIEGCTSEFHEH